MLVTRASSLVARRRSVLRAEASSIKFSKTRFGKKCENRRLKRVEEGEKTEKAIREKNADISAIVMLPNLFCNSIHKVPY